MGREVALAQRPASRTRYYTSGRARWQKQTENISPTRCCLSPSAVPLPLSPPTSNPVLLSVPTPTGGPASYAPA